MSMGHLPVDRVKILLSKLDAVRRSEQRGSEISGPAIKLSGKITGQLDGIFKTIPKPLEWQSFYNNDLNLLVQAPRAGRQGGRW